MAYDLVSVSELVGKTLKEVTAKGPYGDKLTFITEDGIVYEMAHGQSCCEDVHIDDICGDLNDLVGSPILLAREDINHPEGAAFASEEWTFYNIATAKGHVTIKWLADTETCYSVEVSFARL